MRRWADAPTAGEDALPQSLVRRLAEVLDHQDIGANEVADTPETYLSAAEGLLDRLLQEGCSRRERAVDLLTVDALVTYAFEAAAEQPETVAERAKAAIQRFAQLADQS